MRIWDDSEAALEDYVGSKTLTRLKRTRRGGLWTETARRTDLGSSTRESLTWGLAQRRELHKENEGTATRRRYGLAESVAKIHEKYLGSVGISDIDKVGNTKLRKLNGNKGKRRKRGRMSTVIT